MESIREIIECFTKEHGILSYISYIPVALMGVTANRKKNIEPEFMGDNAPYTIIEKIKEHGPRG